MKVIMIVKYDLQGWEHYRLLILLLSTSLDWVMENPV